MSDTSDSSSYEIISTDDEDLDEHLNIFSTSNHLSKASSLKNQNSHNLNDFVLSNEGVKKVNDEATEQKFSIDTSTTILDNLCTERKDLDSSAQDIDWVLRSTVEQRFESKCSTAGTISPTKNTFTSKEIELAKSYDDEENVNKNDFSITKHDADCIKSPEKDPMISSENKCISFIKFVDEENDLIHLDDHYQSNATLNSEANILRKIYFSSIDALEPDNKTRRYLYDSKSEDPNHTMSFAEGDKNENSCSTQQDDKPSHAQIFPPLLPGNDLVKIAPDDVVNHLCGATLAKGPLYFSPNLNGNSNRYFVPEDDKLKGTKERLFQSSSGDNSAGLAFSSRVANHTHEEIFTKYPLGSTTNLSCYKVMEDHKPVNIQQRLHTSYPGDNSARKDSSGMASHSHPTMSDKYSLGSTTNLSCYSILEDNKPIGTQEKLSPLSPRDSSARMAFSDGVVNRLLDTTFAKYPLGSTTNLNDIGSIATRAENFNFIDNSQLHYYVRVVDNQPTRRQGYNSNLSPATSWYKPQYPDDGLRTGKVSYGFFNWFRRNQRLQSFLRIAKNSFNSLLVALDPGMEDIIAPCHEIKISVITNDEWEMYAIRKAFHKVFLNSTYIFINSVDDIVPDLPPQPIGFLSGLFCAEKRIDFMRPSSYSKEIFVAISPLLVEATNNRWHGCHCIVLDDRTRNLNLHVYTQMTPVPNDYIYQSQIRTPSLYPLKDLGLSCTLGQTLAALTGAPRDDWPKTLSGVSYYTTLENAAETLAGMYQCYVNGWMD